MVMVISALTLTLSAHLFVHQHSCLPCLVDVIYPPPFAIRQSAAGEDVATPAWRGVAILPKTLTVPYLRVG